MTGGAVAFGRSLARSTTAAHGRVPVAAAILEVGAVALPVVALVAAFVGTNVALVGAAVFAQFGRKVDVGIFVALAGVREMVPVATGFMLAAKSGAAMAALIATMRLGGQLAALESMAVDPVRHLALPRLIATVVACPLLVSIANAICLASAWAVSVLQLGVEGARYWEAVAEYVSTFDLVVGLVKGLAFGVLIALSALYQGFAAEASPAGVGRAANWSVVYATIACIVVNYLLTELFY